MNQSDSSEVSYLRNGSSEEKSSAPLEPWYQRIKNWVWGYDFFISYDWESGSAYAVDLAARLRERKYEVFLDRAEYASGDKWKRIGEIALRNTQRLVLVATSRAIYESTPVAHEIVKFTDRSSHCIPIFFGQSAESLFHPESRSSKVLERLSEDTIFIEEEPSTLLIGPSADTIDTLEASYQTMRRRSVRQLFVLATLMVLLCFSVLAGISWSNAEKSRSDAESALARALSAAIGESDEFSPSAREEEALWELSQLGTRNQSARDLVLAEWSQTKVPFYAALRNHSRGLHAVLGLNSDLFERNQALIENGIFEALTQPDEFGLRDKAYHRAFGDAVPILTGTTLKREIVDGYLQVFLTDPHLDNDTLKIKAASVPRLTETLDKEHSVRMCEDMVGRIESIDTDLVENFGVVLRSLAHNLTPEEAERMITPVVRAISNTHPEDITRLYHLCTCLSIIADRREGAFSLALTETLLDSLDRALPHVLQDNAMSAKWAKSLTCLERCLPEESVSLRSDQALAIFVTKFSTNRQDLYGGISVCDAVEVLLPYTSRNHNIRHARELAGVFCDENIYPSRHEIDMWLSICRMVPQADAFAEAEFFAEKLCRLYEKNPLTSFSSEAFQECIVVLINRSETGAAAKILEGLLHETNTEIREPVLESIGYLIDGFLPKISPDEIRALSDLLASELLLLESNEIYQIELLSACLGTLLSEFSGDHSWEIMKKVEERVVEIASEELNSELDVLGPWGGQIAIALATLMPYFPDKSEAQQVAREVFRGLLENLESSLEGEVASEMQEWGSPAGAVALASCLSQPDSDQAAMRLVDLLKAIVPTDLGIDPMEYMLAYKLVDAFYGLLRGVLANVSERVASELAFELVSLIDNEGEIGTTGELSRLHLIQGCLEICASRMTSKDRISIALCVLDEWETSGPAIQFRDDCNLYSLSDLSCRIPEALELRMWILAQLCTRSGKWTGRNEFRFDISKARMSICENSSIPELLEVLKWPVCVGEAQEEVLSILGRKTGIGLKNQFGILAADPLRKLEEFGNVNLKKPPIRPTIANARAELLDLLAQ
ncbi:MAG: toll/interleukin-1 receptor domain-containing protein [Verrucomicrobiales bacterium]|nr:toll/interleukin-1 receptor domain-containing protein [Verrucomicrobiales bacterium]